MHEQRLNHRHRDISDDDLGEEWNLMADNVDMILAIPPRYSVSQVVGYIKGNSAIHWARVHGERKRNFVGHSFLGERYFVSTVGRDKAVILEYIRNKGKR